MVDIIGNHLNSELVKNLLPIEGISTEDIERKHCDFGTSIIQFDHQGQARTSDISGAIAGLKLPDLNDNLLNKFAGKKIMLAKLEDPILEVTLGIGSNLWSDNESIPKSARLYSENKIIASHKTKM